MDTKVIQNVSVKEGSRAELNGQVGQKVPEGETRDLNTGMDYEDRRDYEGEVKDQAVGA